MQPERGGVHLLLRHGEIPRADVFHGVELDLLEPDDLAVQADVAMGGFRAIYGTIDSNSSSSLTCV